MPLYVYRAVKAGRCKHCRDGFERFQKVDDRDLSECPICGLHVERIVADETYLPKILRKPGAAEARNAGFKIFKKVGQGEYEVQ